MIYSYHMESKFIHLHTHSHYSLLDGLSKIPDLVKRAKELGMPALAITDHGVMYGAIEFYKECKKQGIKPIIGVEAYIAERTLHDKEPNIDNKRYHLTLLAKNHAGYTNLIRLVSESYLEGYYYKPRMDLNIIKKYSDGLICLTGCPGSRFSKHLRNDNIDDARRLLSEYVDIFGKENVFIEMMNHPEVDGTERAIKHMITLSKETGIPIVGTWDSHYLNKDDREAHDTLLAVNTHGSGFKLDGDYSFIDEERAREVFKDAPEAVENTLKIADMVDIEIPLGSWVFPAFDLEPGETAESQLKKAVYKGIEWRYGKETSEIVDRIEYELKIIKDKGFSIYMLIVGDLIDFAREEEIYTNIRGSVAGSIVTYLLGITVVDPLRFKLPFERFLNPERPSAPDIDMDFADNRREEVLNYAKRKYGEKAVAQIGTFGTMMARGAVKDVARAMGFPYDMGDKISKLIPMGAQGFPMTIERAMEMVPEITEMYDSDKGVKEIIDMAKRLEGGARHISVHAAGVVISPTELADYTPVQLDPKGGKIITQYDMHAVEDAGLIKFDFLGIRNLAILGDAIRIVKKHHGVVIDIEEIDMADKKTFEMLARGETMGVFQLSSAGMTRYLKELRPTIIDDINAMVALYRPGPMEMIPDYIKRKYNSHLITYLDPRLEDILDMSYGVITYQDDVMMIAIKLAGYSWLEADKLRKAMGKKVPEVMAAQKDKLFAGFLEHGLTQAKSQKLWDLIEPFAAYGFNKAHAASYGNLAYKTAFMKANYPVPYITAILTAESGDTDRVSEIIREAEKMGIEVLPPDINECLGNFTVIHSEDETKLDNIRFGFYTIKNLGTDISDAIVEERKKNGKYTSMENFLERVTHKNMNKRALEALLKAGAMNSFGERGKFIANMENLLAFNKSFTKQNKDQGSLFGADLAPKAVLKLEEAEPATKDEKLLWEKELLGVYVSGHPLDKFREKLEGKPALSQVRIKGREDQEILSAGIIEQFKIIITKKNQRMAFLTIADLTGRIEAVVFPKLFKEHSETLEADKCIAYKAKVSIRNGEKSLILDEIKYI
jgi:DNA polymerase III subunit alpha